MEPFIPIIVALVGVIIAWKVLKGLVKTIALVAILAVAAIFVFGV
ncbi:hypothetical protein [Croceicoccus mobilis]|uniref:Uncharacterized protein n=1 Tax=Croceicoccus mobilis TaxID=1703339 RepID=A0A916Z4I9_9SPHN|nr:hypothetical protein [Croceicoccus mobilis]GGD76444.1 hypothetical protein GCM10010990_27660 [Croceicoccus mobilis]